MYSNFKIGFKRHFSLNVITVVLLLPATKLIGQQGFKPSLRAGMLPASFRLDGHLDEPAWIQTDSIANLTVTEPVEGGIPSGRTVVKVLADRSNLVFGVRCLDNQPQGIVAFSKARDAELSLEDHIVLVLDTFLDGRSGYVFAVNPAGARYDALVANQGEDENSNWDTIWEAKTVVDADGWSAEIKTPIKSLSYKRGLTIWGFNVQRRTQRLQETSRWAGAKRDYAITQTSRAGLLTGLPDFDFGAGLSVRPATIAGAGVPAPGVKTEFTRDASLDLQQRVGPNLQASLTINTDFAETEVDARQTNLTRFPLFFPEKRTFFLEGADIFDFGLGLGTDLVPFFSRRIGLLQGQQVPIDIGGKINGRLGRTNLGALMVRTRGVDNLTPGATMGVVRVKQNILAESSVGMIATAGDPRAQSNSWLAGADFTYQTSRFQGDKNFLAGVWALLNNRDGLQGDKSALGLKIDYPNDLWDISLTYKRIGDGFDPSLGFVPRNGIQSWELGADYSPHPAWPLVRQMFFESYFQLVTDLNNNREAYSVFTAPVNWRLESGDRFEFNIAPEGDKLPEPFEIAENVVIPVGSYHWTRYRLEGGLAAKRKVSGQLTWWFGGFYSGTLSQVEADVSIKPSAVFTLEFNGEWDSGRLPQGKIIQRLYAGRLAVNLSPDLQISSFLQYDNESQNFGSNSRLRWTFTPLGDLFIVYNYNLAKSFNRYWTLDSSQLLLKLQYAVRI